MKKSILLVPLLFLSFFGRSQCPATIDAGADVTTCVNTSVTLNAILPIGFTGSWSQVGTTPAAVITDMASPTSAVTGLTASGTRRLVWTITDGAACLVSDTLSILVQANPAANAGNRITACVGATVTMNASSLASGSSGSWSVVTTPDGATLNIASPSDRRSAVTGFSATGVYTLRWTVSNTCATQATDDVDITINANPIQAVAGADMVVCQGDTIRLAGNDPGSYFPRWNFITNSDDLAEFTPDDDENDTVYVAGREGGTATLVYRIANTTSNNTANNLALKCATFDTLIVRVNPSEANAGSDQGFCSGINITATLAATPVEAGETGTWSLVSGTASINNPSDPASTVSMSGIGTVTLRWIVTHGNCKDSSDVNLIVSAPPTIANAPSDLTICEDDTISLEGSDALIGTPSWFISTEDGDDIVRFVPTSGGNLGDTVDVRGREAGTIRMYYIISIGEPDTNNVCASFDSLLITVLPAPEVDPGDDHEVCGGTVITLNADPAAVGETGQWSLTSGTATIADVNNPASTVTMPEGTAELNWTVTNTATSCSASEEIEVTMGSSPTVAETWRNDTTMYLGDTIRIVGSTPLAGTPSWSTLSNPIGQILPGASNNDTSYVRAVSPGILKMRYRISNGNNNASSGCVSVDTLYILIVEPVVSGIKTSDTKGSKISVYPNPGNDLFHISMEDDKVNNAEISLMNSEGTMVFEETLSEVESVNKTFNFSALHQGLYILKIQKGNRLSVSKIIIQ